MSNPTLLMPDIALNKLNVSHHADTSQSSNGRDMGPGIYSISNEDYHNGPAISRSALMEFRKSPYHYW